MPGSRSGERDRRLGVKDKGELYARPSFVSANLSLRESRRDQSTFSVGLQSAIPKLVYRSWLVELLSAGQRCVPAQLDLV